MAATAASTILTVQTGLQVVSQLLALIQAAQAQNTPIDITAWNAVVNARDAALEKLDTDIGKAP